MCVATHALKAGAGGQDGLCERWGQVAFDGKFPLETVFVTAALWTFPAISSGSAIHPDFTSNWHQKNMVALRIELKTSRV